MLKIVESLNHQLEVNRLEVIASITALGSREREKEIGEVIDIATGEKGLQ